MLSPNSDVTQHPLNSNEFVINNDGEVFLNLSSDAASLGTHVMEIRAYNASDPDNTQDFGEVEITILPTANQAPEFYSERFEADVIIAPQPIGHVVFVDLSTVAVDPDYPKIDVGEVVFAEMSESREGQGKGKKPEL